MPLLETPVLTKFFTNKIESSHEEWRAYLLNVANIYAMFDGEVYDRASIEERFETISGRSLDCGRDTSNYRDEFGAYGSYLGVFRLKKSDKHWRIELSNLARQFLCGAEPDISSFCTLQLALFQYPNGMGYAIQRNNTLRLQSNIKENTQNEISHRIRVAPFRLVCRCMVALHQIDKVDLCDLEVSFKTIFKLVNDSDINTTYAPTYTLLSETIKGYAAESDPGWLTKDSLFKFKRNFHILEQTGLLSRSKKGIKLSPLGISAFQKIETIAEINTCFSAFEVLYHASPEEFDETFEEIGQSQAWDKYYDGANLPLHVIQNIVGATNISLVSGEESGDELCRLPVSAEVFPSLSKYAPHERAQYAIKDVRLIDMQASIVAREKANCEHERILRMLNANLLLLGADPFSNIFVDLYAAIEETRFLFEVKSTTETNYISQIRKGISQLYEYRFRLNQPSAILCLVLQNKPKDSWIIDYLTLDRGIAVFWLVDELRFECPVCCSEDLKPLHAFVHVESTD